MIFKRIKLLLVATMLFSVIFLAVLFVAPLMFITLIIDIVFYGGKHV